MDPRSCSSSHYINATKAELVMKKRNVDSCGRPDLALKNMEDIYEGNPVFDCDGVKMEILCMPLVERKTMEREAETDEFNCSSGDDVKDSDSNELNLGEMKFNLLNESCKTKKRKVADSFSLIPKQKCTNLQHEEDEFEYSECQSGICVIDDSSTGNGQVGCRGVQTGEICLPVDCEFVNRESISFAEKIGICVLNEVSYGHIEHVDNELCSKELCRGVQIGENCRSVDCEFVNRESVSFAEKIGICVLNEVSYDHIEHVDKELCSKKLSYVSDFSNFNNYGSSLYSNPCLSHDNGLIYEENDLPTTEENQNLISTITNEARNCFNPNNNSLTNEKKQPIISVSVETESDLSSEKGPCDVFNEFSMPQIKNDYWIPSRTKAISPTSQKRICVALNLVDHYIRKWKQTENEAFLKKPKDNDKRGSHHKGRLKGKKSSISLPRLSSGCKSLQACSESAVVFTQRQMRDMKSVAGKLMDELKCMKKIVEEKMLGEEACSCNIPFKSDADEVKMAIKRATRVEHTSRKCLSGMARNCNRYCKIMTMIEKDDTISENAIQMRRERKKLSFADEAGGMLSHVKLFKNGETFLKPQT